MNQLLQTPFIQVALPIMVTLVGTIWIAQWSQNKRFDDLNRRLDDFRADMNARLQSIEGRLVAIERKLGDHDTRLGVLESPLIRGRG